MNTLISSTQTVTSPHGIISVESVPKPIISESNRQYIGSDTPFTFETAQQIKSNFESLPSGIQKEIERHRVEIADIISGESQRIGIIVGPCSIHNIDEAHAYLDEMEALQNELTMNGQADHIKLIIRLYGEKPRSRNKNAQGEFEWRGFLAHPNIQSKPEQILDLEAVEQFKILMTSAYDRGLAVATEFLNMETVGELGHLPSLVVVGARTVDQDKFIAMSRNLNEIPVGFKNSTDGSIEPAIQAIRNVDNMNPNGFVILRGGKAGPNWDIDHRVNTQLNLPERQLCVDTCHGNSDKKLENTRIVLENLINDIQSGNRPPGLIMIESNLEEGRQEVIQGSELRPGVSITDPCLGINETKDWIRGLANSRQEAVSRSELDILRAEIDRIDSTILGLLASRFSAAEKIGRIKERYGIAALDSGRWDSLLTNLIQDAQQLGLDKSLIVNIWEEIHRYSLEMQNEIIKKGRN